MKYCVIRHGISHLLMVHQWWLLNGMHGYIDHKRYNTPFGDIVPHIVANALEVYIIIMYKNNTNFSCNVVTPTHILCPELCKCIFVLKSGLHYDAVIPIQCNLSHMFGFESLENDSVPRIEIASGNESVQGPGNVSRISKDHVSVISHSCTVIIGNKDINKIPIGFPWDNLENKETNRYELTSLKIVTWNLNSVSQDKLNDNIRGKLFKTYDIIMLSKTWSSDQDDFALDGYFYYKYPHYY